MAISMLCPRCSRRYTLRPEMIGKEVACMCGQTFLVPAPKTTSATQPVPGPSLPPSPTGGSLDDLLGQSLGPSATPGGLMAAAALDGSGPLGGGVTAYRRRRMSAGDIACLATGNALAVIGLGCLFVLYRLLEATGMGWMVAAIVFALTGAGLVAFSLRRNLMIALPVGTAICCLAIVGFVVRPLPKSPEQVAEELLSASKEFVAAMESIRDEETLRQARPKMLDAMAKMVGLIEQAKRLAAQGQKVGQETEQKMEAAMRDFNSRCTAARIRLRGIPGSEELLREVARTFQDAQKRIAAIPDPTSASAAPRPQPLSPQRRQELKDLGVAFHTYLDRHQGTAPRNWEDFEQSLQSNPRTLAVLRKLREDGWVIHWGVNFRNCTVGTSNFILAHAKDAPEKGGPILYMDGACTSLPAEEIRRRLTAQASLEPPEQRLTFAAPSQVATAPAAGIGPSPSAFAPPTTASDDRFSEPAPEPAPARMPAQGFDVGPSAGAEPAASSASSAKPSDAPPAAASPSSPAMPGFPGMAGPPGNAGRKSETVGGTGGSEFLTTRPGLPVVGLAWRPGTWGGKVAIGQIEPLFHRNAVTGRTPSMPGPRRLPAPLQSVVAKDGYAVGGLVVEAGEYVDAVQPIFMRLRPDGKLDPADRYQGPWLGQPSGKPPRTIDGSGAKVIGIHGRGAAVLDAVGLVFD